MVNLPSVRHLRHLLALYECGHFGRAATGKKPLAVVED
jgi:hypothetical protein